jgi:hypothetical protein
LPGSAIDSRTPASQSAGCGAALVIEMFPSVGCSCSKIEARRKRELPQLGHSGIASAGASETGKEQSLQRKEPDPSTGSPVSRTSSLLCPIAVISR